MIKSERESEYTDQMDRIIISLYEHSPYKKHGIPIVRFIEMDWPNIAPLLSKSLQHRGVPNTLLHDCVYGNQYDSTGRFNATAPGLDMSMISLQQTAILFPTSQEDNRCGLLCRPTPDLGRDHPLCFINGETDDVKTTAQQMLGGNWEQMREASLTLDTRTQSAPTTSADSARLSRYTTSIPAPLPPGEYYEMIAHLHSGAERTRKKINALALLINSMHLMYPSGNQHEIIFETFPADAYQLSDILYALQFLGNETHIEISKTGEIHIHAIPFVPNTSTLTTNLEQLLNGITNQEPVGFHLLRLLRITDQTILSQVNTSIRRLRQSWKNGKLSNEKELIEALIQFLKTQTESDTSPGEARRQ